MSESHWYQQNVARVAKTYESLPAEGEELSYMFGTERGQVIGWIPQDLVGYAVYWNGPGTATMPDGHPLDQTFDGDGFITKWTFHSTTDASFQSRFIQTKGYIAERKVGTPLFSTTFSKPSEKNNPISMMLHGKSPFDVKNVSNTGLLFAGGWLYSLWEAGLPYSVDPVSLETIGESRLSNGIVQRTSLCAHWRQITDELGARHVAMSVENGAFAPLVTFFELHPDTGELLCENSFRCVLYLLLFSQKALFQMGNNYILLIAHVKCPQATMEACSTNPFCT